MSTTMSALSSANIRHAEFVRLQIGNPVTTTYSFCNAAAPITVNGITFSNLGMLLQLGDIPQDIKSTSDDITISLTGIDPTNVGIILSSDIKGSTVEIWRGFLDFDNQIIIDQSLNLNFASNQYQISEGGVAGEQFFKRYTGIVNSVGISEDFNEQARTRVATCTISCTSMRKVLENRIAGLRTNQKSWQFFYPGDTSMNRVSSISNQYFDFGAPPKTGSVSDPSNNVVEPSYIESTGA